jgi:hypothetical protein
MLGLFCRCSIKAVYAAHVVAVDLRMPDDRPSHDWLVVQLPVIPPLASRKIQIDDVPPFLPKRMVDPDWASDSTIEQLGPCPKARKAVVAILVQAQSIAVHVPQTAGQWLSNLGPGATLRGDLILDDRPLSELIIAARIARAAD